jgi:predicted nuclease of predicted toxin-antitoxin system
MARPRFLADHDLNEIIVDGVLRAEPTIEFRHVRDFGYERRSDTEVLELAASQQLIVVSHDVNTMSAAAYDRMRAGQPMAGLLLVRQLQAMAPVIESLVMIWAGSEDDEWRDVVTYLPL